MRSALQAIKPGRILADELLMLRLHRERIAVDDALQHRRRVHEQPHAHILRQGRR